MVLCTQITGKFLTWNCLWESVHELDKKATLFKSHILSPDFSFLSSYFYGSGSSIEIQISDLATHSLTQSSTRSAQVLG